MVEQIIRPTGLVDPEVEVRPVAGQMDDLMAECKERVARNERVLVTTLTKRMAEDLTEYLNNMGIHARYLHSDIDTLERVSILQALRAGEFDVLVGINLLREGLDLPEVSLVAILDADKEGFLRSTRSLIQTFGRAARNVGGKVILYADAITRSMHEAMDETERRRAKQTAYNEERGITPSTVKKALDNLLSAIYAQGHRADRDLAIPAGLTEEAAAYGANPKALAKEIKQLEREMRQAAKDLEFERAAVLRDRIAHLRRALMTAGEPSA